ncbi:endonuclease/exonuclease/phosphatase family protein [Parafrankia discariae]|uniref:endonuclease/exonuclease/phosphatase family protein n=1 Tax=Parafrankia discariae TaxID=365528 RepID=UPI000363EECF|nr:endonuclease/exonuclease/phosphatase family protein [Parafrankia discariae]
MDTNADQGMLFADLGDTVENHAPAEDLRLCSLNVNSPSLARAQRLVDWLLSSDRNVLVLTEMQANSGRLIRSILEAHGYRTSCTPGWHESRFHTLIAARGFEVANVEPGPLDPRVVAVDLTSTASTLRLIGVYGPTNGMTTDSSHHRRTFQQQLLVYLTSIRRPGLCVVGDLNVIEPDHRPPLPAFEEHDYAFYRGLIDLGLHDAYRACHPHGNEHSWFSSVYGSQRLDHALISPTITLRKCVYDHSTRHQGLSDHAAINLVTELTENDV